MPQNKKSVEELVETENKRCRITIESIQQYEQNINRFGVLEIDRQIQKYTERKEYEMVSLLNQRKKLLQGYSQQHKESSKVFA